MTIEPLAMGVIEAMFSELSFRDAVLAFPVAVLLHVWEEWPGFPAWARRFASPRYSDRTYVVTHVFAVALALVSAALVRTFPTPWAVFAFFAWSSGRGCSVTRSSISAPVSPPAPTAPAPRPDSWSTCPFSLLLTGLAVHEGMSATALLAALSVAAVFHTLEVGHNVFERW